ncbi:MAG: hypothetical protein U0T73_08855 [Chitinophagales bacterium]
MNKVIYGTIVFAVVILLGSCKKTETVTDDPSVVYKSLNKTVNTVSGATGIDSLDLNQDGLSEVLIQFSNMGADTGIIVMSTFEQNIQFALDAVTPAPYPKLFHLGDVPPTSSVVYNNVSYTSVKYSGMRYGLLNGEGYLAFRFTTGSKFQYGWMHVSLNSAFNEFKVLEYAYSLDPDVPVKVGSK